MPSLGQAATAVAVSFVAYLIGSLSQDIFDQVLPPGIKRLAVWLSIRRRNTANEEIQEQVTLAEAAAANLHSFQRNIPKEQWDLGLEPDQERQRLATRTETKDELDRLLGMLNELQVAGLSEGEKPDAQRPMVQAEATLRTAIVPPLVAVMAYLTATDSTMWVFGVVFAVGLFLQAATRELKARSLADLHYRSRTTDDIRLELESVVRDLASDPGIDAAKLRRDLTELKNRLDTHRSKPSAVGDVLPPQ